MSLRRRLEKYVRDCRTFPADAALAYRNGGMGEVWDTVAPRTVHRVVRAGRLTLFAQPLAEAPAVAPPTGVTISPATLQSCDALAGLVTQRQLDSFRSLLAAGRHCAVAWRGSRPIGYGWVAERIGPDVTLVPLTMPPYAAYLWDLYVLPAERRNGVGKALASARCRIAKERGFREGWRMIDASNDASVHTAVGSGPGVRVLGEMRYIKLIHRLHARFIPAAELPAEII
jgi:ribosomal protein S18 acetylase RimI-like enzyme